MPAKLERCVRKVKSQGKSESNAYGICVKATGCKRKKGGGWAKGKRNIKEAKKPTSFNALVESVLNK